MKKYLYILLPVLFCFLTACSPYSNLKQTQIIDSGKYYRIYKENNNQVRYEIYNPEGKIALSEKTDRQKSRSPRAARMSAVERWM